MKELSEYTDKQPRQELYRRSKKNKISERDKIAKTVYLIQKQK